MTLGALFLVLKSRKQMIGVDISLDQTKRNLKRLTIAWERTGNGNRNLLIMNEARHLHTSKSVYMQLGGLFHICIMC